MADPFDPSDFDAPADNTDADHRALLDAIKQAAADGIRSGAEPLHKAIDASATNHSIGVNMLSRKLDDIETAASLLEKTSRQLSWVHAAHLMFISFAVIAVAFAAAAIWRWAKEPVIERQLYGCTAAWDASNQVCKGEWVLLEEKT